MQQKLKDIALNQVMSATKNHIQIGKLDFRPFNQLQLENVYIDDLQRDTLLYAAKMSASFDLFKLFQSRLLITGIDLEDFSIHLKKNTIDSPFNYQFLVDAFASKDTVKKEGKGMTVIINKIRLNQGRISYDVLSEYSQPDTVLDPHHIRITNLNTELSLRSIDIERLNVAVKSFSFEEKSGFKLLGIQLGLSSNGKRIHLKDLDLRFPHSSIRIPQLNLDYEGLNLSQLLQGANYSLDLKIDSLRPVDFKMFSPDLGQWNDALRLDGNISGKLPGVALNKFQAEYGSLASLDMKAFLQDFTHWQTSGFQLTVHHLFLGEVGLGSEIPVRLSGSISGSLPDFQLGLETQSGISRLSVKGKGGYLVANSESRFDLDINGRSLDLKRLLKGMNDLGQADFQLSAQGCYGKKGGIQVNGQMDIARIDYKQYPYRDISLKAAYGNDSLWAQVESRDANAPFELDFNAGSLTSKIQDIDLFVKLDHVRPDTLNLLKNFKGADLYTVIRAQLKGLNPESSKMEIGIDTLHLRTEKGEFSAGQSLWSYEASKDDEKKLTSTGHFLDASLSGRFKLNSLAPAFQNTLSFYFPKLFPEAGGKTKVSKDNLDFDFRFRNLGPVSQTLGIPYAIADTSFVRGNYRADLKSLSLDAHFNRLQYNETFLSNTFLKLKSDSVTRQLKLQAGSDRYQEALADTLRVGLQLENLDDGLSIAVKGQNRNPKLDVEGELAADLHYHPKQEVDSPKMNVHLKPTLIRMNSDTFQIHPANFQWFENRYFVDNFKISHSDLEFFNINGAISPEVDDTLTLDLSKINLGTIARLLNLQLDLKGEANGQIVFNQLTTSPLITTENFSVRDIRLKGKEIGTLDAISTWSDDRKGLIFNANLHRPDADSSHISGYLLPKEDSLFVDADIRSVLLDWISPFTEGILFDLGGEIGAKVRIEGTLKSPQSHGFINFKDARLGVKMFNTRYRISDSIFVQPDLILFKGFQIKDENNHAITIGGEVKHKLFTSLDPNLKLDVQDFLVLNNPKQTDSLFFGNLQLNGTIEMKNTGNNLLIQASLENSPGSRIFVNIPQSPGEAQRYSSVTFVDADKPVTDSIPPAPVPETKLSLPVRIDLSLSVNSGLKLGAIFNPVTKDSVNVSGKGNLDFTYDLNTAKMNLLGDYIVKEGQAVISLKNITRKVFKIQEGGRLNFRGDPAATAFNLTAIYGLRADLSSLDAHFADLMSSTKVPVNCLLTASGDVNQLKLNYDIDFPNEREEIKRKASGLINTEDLKIKEIAYLLAFGTFYPVNNTSDSKVGPNIWTSLASSSMTSQLNNLLSGVMKENWSIGTEVHSTGSKVSDMEMEVNVSTHLLNNRLVLNSNIGYRNNQDAGATSNFTGDFDMQYKLTHLGDFILKVYNVTNDAYYEKARTTQGVGVTYKKESRSFKNLFKWFKKGGKK